jgi:hypothetical protein
MATYDAIERPRVFRDLDPATRARELASLQTELVRPDPITVKRLNEWVSVSDDRQALLRGGVWCGIRWSKALGRPQTPSITAGFTVTHEFERIEFSDLGGGSYRDDSHYVLQPTPSLWDATNTTSDEYRVGIFFFAGGGGINPNRLNVTLAPVPWTVAGHFRSGYRELDPRAYGPFGNLGERVVIPDYMVRHVPYHLGAYLRALGPSLDRP